MPSSSRLWPSRDDHKLFEYQADFNDWLDRGEASDERAAYGVDDTVLVEECVSEWAHA